MRPQTLEQFVGQAHLMGPGKIIRDIAEKGEVVSMIFWGPPGSGKTTLARILAGFAGARFHHISAVTSGLADVRKIIEEARLLRRSQNGSTILFIDEIHRFNKAQQDALLHSVEDGTITLMGATTENPSFEVISPLLSRSRVYQLHPLTDTEIKSILKRALKEDEVLSSLSLEVSEDSLDLLTSLASGDARIALNGLELCSGLAPEKNGKRRITPGLIKKAMQRTPRYDKKGEAHYNTISAFIKSMRGSDPDGAVYWLARMLQAGEDPLFIARRMVILASEDIGNAAPTALVLANAAFQAVHAVGMPEARIILSQAATYLASAPKSNASYTAIEEAARDALQTEGEPVPLHLRNAPTKLMKSIGYGKGYRYAHDDEQGFMEQTYLPEKLKSKIYYHPKAIGSENEIRKRLKNWWKKKRGG